jgi:hypothetical protein
MRGLELMGSEIRFSDNIFAARVYGHQTGGGDNADT